MLLSLDKQRDTLTAAADARATAKGRMRQDVPQDFWKSAGDSIGMGLENFRLTVLHGGGGRTSLDDIAEAVSWTEPSDSAIFTGNVSVRAPIGTDTETLGIAPGDRLLCEASEHGQNRYVPLWVMRVREPSASVRDGSRSFVLANDLILLSSSIDDFNYGKSKKRPRGWRVDQAFIDVCTRYGVKVRIPTLVSYLKKKIALDTTPLRILNDFMLFERNKTGRRFTMRYDSKGILNVLPLRRSESLLLMGKTIIEASLQQSFRPDFATVLTVRAGASTTGGTAAVTKKATSKHKKVAARKISVEVSSGTAVARYGYIHRIVYAHGADSDAEAREMGEYHLAQISRPDRTMTITHPGIATVRKGDAIRLSLPEVGLSQIVYVAEVTHNVTPGSYTMDVTLTFDDPYVDKKVDRVNEQKGSVATTRGRKGSTTKKAAVPTRNRALIDKPKGPSKGDKLKAAGQR